MVNLESAVMKKVGWGLFVYICVRVFVKEGKKHCTGLKVKKKEKKKEEVVPDNLSYAQTRFSSSSCHTQGSRGICFNAFISFFSILVVRIYIFLLVGSPVLLRDVNGVSPLQSLLYL